MSTLNPKATTHYDVKSRNLKPTSMDRYRSENHDKVGSIIERRMLKTQVASSQQQGFVKINKKLRIKELEDSIEDKNIRLADKLYNEKMSYSKFFSHMNFSPSGTTPSNPES